MPVPEDLGRSELRSWMYLFIIMTAVTVKYISAICGVISPINDTHCPCTDISNFHTSDGNIRISADMPVSNYTTDHSELTMNLELPINITPRYVHVTPTLGLGEVHRVLFASPTSNKNWQPVS
jgi:hypothetical protein